MNTSMTINATAMWLLALYQVVAEEQAEAAGEDPAEAVRALAGTTQNDIIKEYLSRGTYVFPPAPSMRLITDMVAYTVARDPAVEPDQHLQLPPAGGRRDAGAGDRLRDVDGDRRARRGARLGAGARGALRRGRRPDLLLRQRRRPLRRGDVQDARLRPALGRDHPRALRRHRTPSHRRFRYGVQVNSLGLTEAQPENNVQRIVLEMLAVTLSKDARARAVQLPAWNEALGLPASVGPAVVAADPAGPGLRVRPARVRRPVRRVRRRRGQGRRARRRGARRDRPGPGDGRRGAPPSRAAT